MNRVCIPDYEYKVGLYFDNYSNWAKSQPGYTAPTDEYIVANYEAYLDGFMLKKNISQY